MKNLKLLTRVFTTDGFYNSFKRVNNKSRNNQYIQLR